MITGRLVAIDRRNWRRATEVRVHPDQLRFVAEHQPVALVIMAKAYVGASGWEWDALAFETEGGDIVAVLGLAHIDKIGQIINLAVDVAHQGRGVGRAVVEAVIDLARQRGWSTIRLAVTPDNVVARRLYAHAGFVPTGETSDGEPVLAYTVAPAAK